MPRHFSPADREYALERLIANRGDVNRTANELGIHAATLYKWRKKAKIADSLSSFSSPISPNDAPPPYEVGRGLGGGDTLPPDDLTALRDLKSQMITIAKTLADSVIQAIEDAPLGQRVAALTQLTDRIMKLAAQLPGESEESEIRIVIVDEEGNAHTPIPDPDEDYR